MAYRIVMIESETRLSLKLNNLVVDKGEGEIWIPLDDISVLVIDNLNTTITARMLSIIAEQNIALFVSDQKHLPAGVYTAFDNHSRIAKTIGYQLEKKEDYYDLLWKEIISAKINNQKKVLLQLEKEIETIEKLKVFSEELVPGDATNREAHAAKVYFNSLMGTSFSRGNEELLINSGLDYIYAVIRAYLARECVAYGLVTQLGIHHRNEYNRFNLVDDLIEPIRPIADIFTYRLLVDSDYFLPEHRKNLINFLNHRIVYCGKSMYVCNMLEEYVEQYAALLAGRREYMTFPDVDCYMGEDKDEI